MKNKKNKKTTFSSKNIKSLTMGLAAITAISLVGCDKQPSVDNVIQFDSTSGSSVAIEKSKLTESEQKAFIESLVLLNEQGIRPTEFEVLLDNTLDKLSKENASLAVQELIKSVETSNSYFSSALQFMSSEISYSVIVDNLTDVSSDLKNTTNEFADGYVKELQRQHSILNVSEAYFTVVVDYEYLLNEYSDYMEKDLKSYIDISAKQQTDPLFDETTSMYSFDRIVEDLENLEETESDWSEGEYAENFMGLEIELYQALFNSQQSTFFDITEATDTTDTVYTLKEDIKTKYTDYIQAHSDTEIGKNMKTYVEKLSSNGYVLDDAMIEYADSLIVEVFSTDDTSSTTETEVTE